MTRACQALISYGIQEMGLLRFEVVVDIGNQRSRLIPERLGFSQTAIRKDHWQSSEGPRDAAVYTLTTH